MAFRGDDISINTFIGSGSAVSGNLKIAGFVTIHGDITAKSAIIGGVVEGNVTAPDFVQLFQTASVVGDISTRKLVLEDGVLFHGHCISLSDEEEYQEARSKLLDRVAIASSTALLHSSDEAL